MGFADIIPTTQHYGAEARALTDFLSGYDDVELIEDILIEEARLAVKIDLADAWSLDLLDATDLATLDEQADSVAPKIRAALAAKQLELIYLDQGGDDDSVNRHRWRIYADQYIEHKRSMHLWGNADPGETARVGVIRRTA